MNSIIKAENISKCYRLGTLGSGSLKDDLRKWFGNKNKRRHLQFPDADDPGLKNKYLWALRDINFEIAEGEVVGFIGRNGAGKSTLLKIISQITLPTTGTIRGHGNVASLLEVGTGFHQELTGRENIFLNGSILGMKKNEIKNKFDEIVEFSGVSRFLDTPVKRYSSGMYVRLAFAVAAHLDPDILIVDEVLAVGDAEFQKKCLGKMKQVSEQSGKTVLFVSHNMQAVRNICQRAFTLEQGSILEAGDAATVTRNYLKKYRVHFLEQTFTDSSTAPGNEHLKLRQVQLVPEYQGETDVIDIRTPFTVQFSCWYKKVLPGDLVAGVHVFSVTGECIFDVCSARHEFSDGIISGSCSVPGKFLNEGSYYISIVFVRNVTERICYFESCISFDVEDYREADTWYGKWLGVVRPDFPVLLRQELNEPD